MDMCRGKKTRYAKTNQKGRACSSSSDCKNSNKYMDQKGRAGSSSSDCKNSNKYMASKNMSSK